MELAGKALWRRVLNALFIAGVLFVVTAIAGDGIQWTLLLVGAPLFFGLNLVGDAVLRRLRQWWVA